MTTIRNRPGWWPQRDPALGSQTLATAYSRARVTKFVKTAKAQGHQLTFLAWEDWPEPRNRDESKAVARIVTKV
jgi:hypothetical protein